MPRARFPDPNMQIWSFLTIEGDPDRMYAGASPVAVYRSDDRGRSYVVQLGIRNRQRVAPAAFEAQ